MDDPYFNPVALCLKKCNLKYILLFLVSAGLIQLYLFRTNDCI